MKKVAAIMLVAGLFLAPASAAHAESRYESVTITVPDDAGTVGTNTPRFAGAGHPGAYVIVRDPQGTVLCAARVGAQGWSCESVVDMGDGPTSVTATQNAWGATSTAITRFDVFAADRPAFPQWLPTAIGVGIAALLALAFAIFTIWRKRNATERSPEDASTDEHNAFTTTTADGLDAEAQPDAEVQLSKR